MLKRALFAVALFLSGFNIFAATPSPDGSAIPFTDNGGHQWSVIGGVAYEDGKLADYSAGVTLLQKINGVACQFNSKLWWCWDATQPAGKRWTPPTGSTSPVTPNSSSSGASSSSGSSSSSSSSSSGASSSSSSSSSGGSASGSSSGSSSSGSSAFGIKVSGNKLVSTKDGSQVFLLGDSASGMETGSDAGRVSQFGNAGPAFWTAFKNYNGNGVPGLNVVRIPQNSAAILGYACGSNPVTWQTNLKKAVADATGAGLYVIIDLHWDSIGTRCPTGQPGFPSTDHALDYWRWVANAFKNNPAVMFDIFNEPYGDGVYAHSILPGDTQPGPEAFVWRDGGTDGFCAQQGGGGAVACDGTPYQIAGAQQLINAIRATGATNVILTSPIWWAGQIQVWLASRPTDPINQLGVSWHIYGFNRGPSGPLAVAAVVPVVVTETYGFNAALNGGSDSSGYAWARQNISGVLCWGVVNDWGGQALSVSATPPWNSCPRYQ